MAYDKMVDSGKLDGALRDIADTIRMKTDSAAPIALEDMPLAISLIEGGVGGTGDDSMKLYQTVYTVTDDDVARLASGNLTKLLITLPKPASEDTVECGVMLYGDSATGIECGDISIRINDTSAGWYPGIQLGNGGKSTWSMNGVLVKRIAKNKYVRYFCSGGFSTGFASGIYVSNPSLTTLEITPTVLTKNAKIYFYLIATTDKFAG